MFDDEFSDLHPEIAAKLRERLEEVVRFINGRYIGHCKDPQLTLFTKEQLHAMVGTLFDLANRLKMKDLDR